MPSLEAFIGALIGFGSVLFLFTLLIMQGLETDRVREQLRAQMNLTDAVRADLDVAIKDKYLLKDLHGKQRGEMIVHAIKLLELLNDGAPIEVDWAPFTQKEKT